MRLDPCAEKHLLGDELARLQDSRKAIVRAAPRSAHARLLHPDVPGIKGSVTLMRSLQQPDGEYRWETRVVSTSELLDSDALLWATHIGMQRHYGARGSTALAQVQSLIADLDCHDCKAFRGLSPEEMAGLMIERIEVAGLPLPSYILFSGRGLHLVWLHEPRMAQPGFMKRWRAVQRWLHGPKNGKASATVRTATGMRMQDPEVVAQEEKLAAVWAGTGLDRGACDTARVLRLAGTFNPKSGKIARLAWPASWADVVRHDFETLAAAFLPFKRYEMAALKAEREAGYRLREATRQARRAEAETAGLPLPLDEPRRRRPGNRWAAVVDALDAIRTSWGGTPPEGRRNLWAFLSACAIAMDVGGAAATWATRLAPLAGLPESELRASLGGLERILRRHEAGETSERDGVERPAMYAYSSARMLTLLGVTEEFAASAGAWALLPGDARPKRSEQARSAERRAAAGATPTKFMVACRLADGREALALRAQGMSMAAIVQEFAGRRARTSLFRAMAEAEASNVVLQAPVEIDVEQREGQLVSAVHGSTLTIVALPEAHASKVAPPVPGLFEAPGQTSPIIVPNCSPAAEGQGDPLVAPASGMDADSGAPFGGGQVGLPGPATAASILCAALPNKDELPAVLTYLQGFDVAPSTFANIWGIQVVGGIGHDLAPGPCPKCARRCTLRTSHKGLVPAVALVTMAAPQSGPSPPPSCSAHDRPPVTTGAAIHPAWKARP